MLSAGLIHPQQRWPWVTALAVALLLGLALAPQPWPDVWAQHLALQRDLAWSQPWRWWTAPWVHFGTAHALWDGLGLLLVGSLLERAIGARRWLAGLLLTTPLLSGFILWAEPQLQQYRGASGLVVLLLLAYGMVQWQQWRGSVASRRWLLLAAGVLLAKLGWDVWLALQGQQSSSSLPSGVSLAWSAHVGGALLGLAWGGWLAARSAFRA